MNAQTKSAPCLRVDADVRDGDSGGVGVHALDPDLTSSLERYLQAGGPLRTILRVAVARMGPSSDDGLPDVAGRYRLSEGRIQFIPYFPFERGLSYRACFDPRPLGRPETAEALTLEFSLPRELSASTPQVDRIFPSGVELPENLLRFYISFSNPMQRGHARAEITLLGPDGEPVPDALYRAPVELWDRSMRRLTVLLDPGRLKRGVGPNRELGPPLKTGQTYTLAIGAGMTDAFGGQLPEPVYKRFRVIDPVREAIAVDRWTIAAPARNSRQPLAITFPRPLDQALLSDAIAVLTAGERAIDGQVEVDRDERRWLFTPNAPWAAGSYRIRIAPTLEDICGNSVTAPFDRPLRPAGDLACEAAKRSIPFNLL
jgi:hypothetical protein